MSGVQAEIPEELHVLAGEYVLGTLEGDEIRAVRRQAMADPRLARAIDGWERRLTPLAAAVPDMTPPDALWARIEQSIAPAPEEPGEEAPPAARPALRPVALRALERPLPDPARLPVAATRRVWPWKAATVASLALAASVAGVVLMPSLALQLHVPVLGERFAPAVAVLMPAEIRGSDTHSDGSGTTPQMASETNAARFLEPRPEGLQDQTQPAGHVSAFLAQARLDGTIAVTALAPVDVPAGKVLELWILPPGATVPTSLGLLPSAGRHATLPDKPTDGTALLVSLEPPGGSPTGQPTGPVVYKGTFQRLPL